MLLYQIMKDGEWSLISNMGHGAFYFKMYTLFFVFVYELRSKRGYTPNNLTNIVQRSYEQTN